MLDKTHAVVVVIVSLMMSPLGLVRGTSFPSVAP